MEHLENPLISLVLSQPQQPSNETRLYTKKTTTRYKRIVVDTNIETSTHWNN